MDIKDRIEKLLALSGSPNENEARLALLKARELMTQYKLTEQDLAQGMGDVVHRETQITFSKRRASWTLQLANVISENYLCRAFARRRSRQQTRTVCLAGFPDDVLLCEKVLTYALSCINAWIRRTASLNKELYTAKELGRLSDSYAKGYIAGIYAAYRRQAAARAQEWALVSAASGEVERSVASLRYERMSSDDGVVQSIYNIGFGDGVRFSVADKLEAKRRAGRAKAAE